VAIEESGGRDGTTVAYDCERIDTDGWSLRRLLLIVMGASRPTVYDERVMNERVDRRE